MIYIYLDLYSDDFFKIEPSHGHVIEITPKERKYNYQKNQKRLLP